MKADDDMIDLAARIRLRDTDASDETLLCDYVDDVVKLRAKAVQLEGFLRGAYVVLRLFGAASTANAIDKLLSDYAAGERG
jgi:hypothetical protein